MPPALENELSGSTMNSGRQARLLAQKKDELATITRALRVDKRRWEIKADLTALCDRKRTTGSNHRVAANPRDRHQK